METDRLFTGQRSVASLGLMDYHARFYDAYLGRFISADSIVSDYANPQSLNRYSYVLNSPISYGDPTGNVLNYALRTLRGGIWALLAPGERGVASGRECGPDRCLVGSDNWPSACRAGPGDANPLCLPGRPDPVQHSTFAKRIVCLRISCSNVKPTADLPQ